MSPDLAFARALADMASLAPGCDDRPCSHCLALTRVELLVEADARLWPMEEVCETCSAELLSDLEDELPSDAELRRRESAVRFGGGGWLEDE